MRQHLAILLLAAAGLALGGCGGGGTQVASIPTPPVTPTPTPTPTSVLPPAHLGLVSSAPFAVLSMGDTYSTRPAGNTATLLSGPAAQNVQFSYDPAENIYFISLPGFQQGMLGNTGYNGSAGQVATSSVSHVLELSFGIELPATVFLPVPGSNSSPYTYTSFGSWNGQTGVSASGDILHAEGIFAYGIPTAAGDVPTIGTAGYTAEIIGSLGPNTYPPNGVEGQANLLFDFAGGTLSGSMHPRIVDSFDGIFVDFGQFDFKNTVYSSGSATFSGQFVAPGLPNASSSFNGLFTGPHAAELMAQFQTPYLLNGDQGTISGVWVGKKN